MINYNLLFMLLIPSFVYTQIDTIHHNRSLILDEVVMKASPKIIVKPDTVSFSADAFIDNSASKMEQLLRKLPGIDVSKDGSITMNGKKIERILIDGEDIFGKDYTLISRNLSARLIEKIQVIDNYSNNPLLKGLLKNENKVINLVLKKGNKQSSFGEISASKGTMGRQEISLNVISLSEKRKIYSIVSHANTGLNLTPNMPQLTGLNSMNSQTSGPADMTNRELITTFSMQDQDINPEKITINNSSLLSCSFSQNPYPNMTVRLSGWSFIDNSSISLVNNSDYKINNSILNIQERNLIMKKPFHINTRSEIAYRCDRAAELKLSTFLSSSTLTTSAIIATDKPSMSSNALQNNSYYLHNTLNYTKRIDSDKAILLEAGHIQLDSRQQLSTYKDSVKPLPFTSISPGLFVQSVYYPSTTTYLFLRYIRNYKHHFRIHLDASSSAYTWHLRSYLDTTNNNRTDIGISENFSNNNYLYRYISIIKPGVLFQKKKFQFTSSLGGTFLKSRYKAPSAVQSFGDMAQYYFYPSIEVSVKWKRNQHNIYANYAYNNQPPAISDMYEGFIITDDRTIRKGTNTVYLKPIQTIALGYNCINLPRQIMIYSNISILSTNDRMSNSTTLTDHYIIITPAQYQSAMIYYLSVCGIDKFIPFLQGGIKMRNTISINKYASTLNNNHRQIQNLNSTTQLSFRSTFKKFFNYNIGIISGYSKSKAKPMENINFKNQTLTGFLDLIFKISNRLDVIISNEYYDLNYLKKNENAYYFANFHLSYEFIKSKLSFKLTGSNLTNNKTFISTQLADYFAQVRRYKIMPLYLMIHLNCRF